MKIQFCSGNDVVTVGKYTFRLCEIKEIPADIAEALLKKTSNKFIKVEEVVEVKEKKETGKGATK